MIENQKRELLPWFGAGSRIECGFHFSFAASPGGVKGTD